MDLSLEASPGSVNPGVELPLNWSYRNYRELQGHGAIFAPSSQESIPRGCSKIPSRVPVPCSLGGMQSKTKMLQQLPRSCCQLTFPVQLYPLPSPQSRLRLGDRMG